jgi:hypothetical protein
MNIVEFPNRVILTQQEMEMASFVGCKRRCESKSKSRKDNDNLKNVGFKEMDFWGIDIEGAAAEMAYCKFTNQFWSGSVNSFKAPDCGSDIQIRSTKLNNGCLIVREKDPDSDYYVLVSGIAPEFIICGWIRGSDAKKKSYERAPNNRTPAYFVPQSALNPIK